jgi:hypothetical protein
MGAMSGIVRLSAMAVWLAAASGHGGNRTGLKIAELREFLKEVVTAVEQIGQRIWHEELQVMI